MPLSSRIVFTGVSKQTAKGSADANPTYGHGIRSGQVSQVELDQSADELTSTERFNSAALRSGVSNGADFVTRCYPASLGLYYYAALGAVQTTGAGDYTHDITPAATLPYLSQFGRIDSEYFRIQDSKVDQLTVTWDGTQPPELGVRTLGGTLLVGTSWTATTDESTDEFLPTAGGTFSFDGETGTAVTANVVGGSITINNNLSPIVLSTSIDPSDVWEAVQTCEITLRIIPDNLNDWQAVVTGTDAGTAVQATPTYGSFDITFTESATVSLQLAATRCAFTADIPDGNPAGDAVELTLVGEVLKPAGTDALTVTVKNQEASY